MVLISTPAITGLYLPPPRQSCGHQGVEFCHLGNTQIKQTRIALHRPWALNLIFKLQKGAWKWTLNPNKFPTHYGLNICICWKFTCWNMIPQCDGIRRWGNCKVTRLRWGHKDGVLLNGISALCWVMSDFLRPPPPMDWSTPGFPILRYLPEFVQTHVHWVGDVI